MATTSAANIYRDSVIQSFIKITVSAYGCNTATNKKVTLVQSGEGGQKTTSISFPLVMKNR